MIYTLIFTHSLLTIYYQLNDFFKYANRHQFNYVITNADRETAHWYLPEQWNGKLPGFSKFKKPFVQGGENLKNKHIKLPRKIYKRIILN